MANCFHKCIFQIKNKTPILLQIPLICFFKGFSGSSHLWETKDRWRWIHWNGILDRNESRYIKRSPSESKQQSPRSTCESLKRGADERWAHGRVRIGCDGGDGRAAFSDLQTEELPLQQAQVVEDLVQQNHTFILFLKDGKNKQQTV